MAQTNATPKDLAELVFEKIKHAKTDYSTLNEQILNNLFDTLFYTSLKTEEGQYIKVTITLIDPSNPDPTPPKRVVAHRWECIALEKPIPFTVKNLVKLSKAADMWSSSLAVFYNDENELIIWGMIDQAVHYQSFLNYETESGPEQPGFFQSTISGVGNIVVLFDYHLIANLKQDTLISNYIDVFKLGTVKEILDKNSSLLKRRIRNYLNNNFPDDNLDTWKTSIENIFKTSLSRLLLRIQNYGHGGAILITNNFDPSTSGLDIKYSINYVRLSTAITRAAQLTIAYVKYSDEIFENYLESAQDNLPTTLYLDEAVSQSDKRDTMNEVKGAIRFISSLSCVDGLIVLNNDLKVKGFGAIIKAEKPPKYIYTSDTSVIIDSSLKQMSSDHFGTRHRSMFSFCWNNLGSLGFVVSQDGDIRAITRVDDKLIMWENIKVQQFINSRKLRRPFLKKVR